MASPQPISARLWSGFRVFAFILLQVVAVSPVRSACPDGSLFKTPAVGYPAGTNPHDVILADFNEDGRLDVALPNTGSNTVSVRMGQGSGAFGPQTQYPTASSPYALASGDFNGDGILDLVVSCQGNNSVGVLIGQGAAGVGNGTFASGGNFAAGSLPFRVVAGDFNEDGRLDVAVVDNAPSGAIAVLIAKTPGSPGGVDFFAPALYPTSSTPVSMIAGDFNEDGILDLAATLYSPGKIAILRGQGSAGVGDGTFASPVEYASCEGGVDLQSGDFDEDGILDLTVGANGDGVGVHRGLGSGGVGNGTFGPVTFLAKGTNQADVAIADFDGDGILDIASSSPNLNAVLVYRGLGTAGVGNGTFGGASSFPVGSFPIGIDSGDLDGDGLPDVISAEWLGSEFRVLLTTCPAVPTNAPVLDAVRDVPKDQGGRVFVLWRASALDGQTGSSVTGYRVWRRVPPLAATSSTASAAPASAQVLLRADGVMVTYWEAMATLPAQRLEAYGYTAPTTQDSLPGSNPFTAFFVTALTADPNVFYNSNVDSGYSVDNLSPAQPSPFAAEYLNGEVHLHWGVSSEQDLFGYRLYRGNSADFVPSPANLVIAQPDTGFVDRQGNTNNYYKLSAVDIHGNQSFFALVSPGGPTPSLASLVSAEYIEGRVQLKWLAASNPNLSGQLYRRTPEKEWQSLALVSADESGWILYQDSAVEPGLRYGYRLGILDGDQEVFVGEAWVDVPALRLALHGALPNPSASRTLTLAFTLPNSEPAVLELFDASGRLVQRRDVGSLGAGYHEVRLRPERKAGAGVYLIRLRQGSIALTTKAITLQ